MTSSGALLTNVKFITKAQHEKLNLRVRKDGVKKA